MLVELHFDKIFHIIAVHKIKFLSYTKHVHYKRSQTQTFEQSTRSKNHLMSNLQPVGDSSFDTDVLQSTTPVLVDFWAEWCNPCKMIAPLLEEAAITYAGKIKMVKLNVDENNATAAKFGIRGIPTLLIFKNGKVAATKVGHLTKSQLSDFLDSHSG